MIRKILDKPYFLLPCLLILWGTYSAGSKIAQRTLDVHQLQFYIFLTAFAAYVLIMLLSKKGYILKNIPARQLPLLFLCGFLVFGYFFLYNMALSTLDAAEASIINYTFPVLIVALDIVINHSRVSWAKVLSVLIGLFGVIFIITDGKVFQIKFSNLTGDLLAFLGAVCWALFSILGRRISLDLVASNFIYTLIGLVLSFGEMMLFSKPIIPDASTLLCVVWVGGFTFAFSNYLWLYALKVLDVNLAANVSFITPFITMIFIALLLHEEFTLVQCSGFVIILIGIAVQRLHKVK